jgi:hypothetical protein
MRHARNLQRMSDVEQLGFRALVNRSGTSYPLCLMARASPSRAAHSVPWVRHSVGTARVQVGLFGHALAADALVPQPLGCPCRPAASVRAAVICSWAWAICLALVCRFVRI